MSNEHQELDDSVVNVARAAQELSDGAIHAGRDRFHYMVKDEDMNDLRAALLRWQYATDAFTKAVKEGKVT